MQRFFNVVLTLGTDALSSLYNVENPTSDFVSFTTWDPHYLYVAPQRSNNVDPTLTGNIFSKCPLIWDSISKTRNIFRNILGSTYWLQSIRKKKNNTRNFCLFVYLQSYNNKSKFSFLQPMQSSRNMSYLQTSHFSARC